MRRAGWAALVGALGVGALASREAAAVARAVRQGDEGDRADHASTVGEGIGEALDLVLLGDSAVDGYGLTAGQSLPRQLASRVAVATGRRVCVRSVAVSGATTTDVVAFQLPLLRAAGDVDAVLVGVGVNDALKRTRAAVLEESTTQLALGLQRIAPDAAIAVVVCHDLSTAPGFGPVLRRVVGRRCRAVAKRQRAVLEEHGVPVVDIDGPGTPDLYGRDGLHPGAPAIRLIADRAVATLVAPTGLGV